MWHMATRYNNSLANCMVNLFQLPSTNSEPTMASVRLQQASCTVSERNRKRVVRVMRMRKQHVTSKRRPLTFGRTNTSSKTHARAVPSNV